MSCKLSNNSIKLNCESQQWVKAPSLDTSVKLAGDESKDRLYEPKHKKKLVRVLTVVAYVFFVSLAAIMLSLYYVFLWNGYAKEINQNLTAPASATQLPLCRNSNELNEYFNEENTFTSTPVDEQEELIDTETEDPELNGALSKRSILFKQLFYKKLIN